MKRFMCGGGKFFIFLAIICVIGVSSVSGATVYSNTNTSGNYYPPGAGMEAIDYGTVLNDGEVTGFKFGYTVDSYYSGSVTIRFYKGTNYYSTGKSNFLASFTINLPNGLNTSYWYEHTHNIPVD